jgi:16S rRNA (adenine1518-N6/adenine1519-N6)-dimethyltransferase
VEARLERQIASARARLKGRAAPSHPRLSQHFLLDAALLRRIVALAGDVSGRDVLEIGPGPGGLTAALLDAGARVTALELDPDWAAFTAGELRDAPLEVRRQDALATAPGVVAELAARAGRPPLVVANLPYAIASPLLVDLVRGAPAEVPERIVVMIQREVAERLCAPPGGRTRGLLTLLIALRARARRHFVVAPGSFTPPPRVASAIVEIVPDRARAAAAAARPQLEALLRAAFQARRKMLRRALADVVPAECLAKVPERLLTRRPEELADEEWLTLADAVAAPVAKE